MGGLDLYMADNGMVEEVSMIETGGDQRGELSWEKQRSKRGDVLGGCDEIDKDVVCLIQVRCLKILNEQKVFDEIF